MKSIVPYTHRVVVMKNHTFIGVDEDQYKKIRQIVCAPNPPSHIEINGEIIERFSILGILKQENAEEYIGLWAGNKKCPGCGNWIPKNHQCGYCMT